MHRYVEQVLERTQRLNPGQVGFFDSVKELLVSVDSIMDQHPEYEKAAILERMTEPERIICFRVPWQDDKGTVHINKGYRVQFSSAIGPYKGGLRFAENVNLDILKSLAFEQIFKNSLTGLPMGGGKGGADFSPKGRSDDEIMRFCQSFIQGLYKYIGAGIDVPAGDLGVSGKEIGYMFGEYKRLKSLYEGVFTGKGMCWGGSNIRPEATGYGLVYFVQHMLASRGESIEGKRVCVSGFGNVAWGACKKARALGAKVVTISGSAGYIYDEAGLDEEKIEYMLTLRKLNQGIGAFQDKFKGTKFFPGKRPWGEKCDIALPCACQNEMNASELQTLVNNGCKVVAEGSNLSLTSEAVELTKKLPVMYSPGKASNAGGVACSGLEMSQNFTMEQWSSDIVDQKLKDIMFGIHKKCVDTAAQYGKEGDYVFGANVAGFLKVATAMLEQGLV